MTVEALLSRLERVKRTGDRRWLARCPAHDDRGPSLSIRELDDGRVLLHCFAMCNVTDVLNAAGLELVDLFPPRTVGHAKPERRPFAAMDVLRAVAFEAGVVAFTATELADGRLLTNESRERLLVAAGRLNAAVDVAEGRQRG